MKITMTAFLSATLALALLLTGCMKSDADKESTPTKEKMPISIEDQEEVADDEDISTLIVSPAHEKLIKDALESAKQGKQVPMDKDYKEVSWGEIEKVLGEPAMSGPEDGGSSVYAAGKYEIMFMFNCSGKCSDTPEKIHAKLVSMQVGEAEVTK